jgi:hypothetical protein
LRRRDQYNERSSCLRSGPLAQLAEQQTLNLRVLGSIPRRLTNLRSSLKSLSELRLAGHAFASAPKRR